MAKKTFEEALRKLDELVDSLENDDLNLEDAVKKFEEGIRLSKFCEEKLDEAEEKIFILKKEMDGSLKKESADSSSFEEPDVSDE